MSEPKTYLGSCHCGAVRFEVTTDLTKIISCNCSICRRTGALLAFVPDASFKLLAGEAEMTDYQFNKKYIHHTFCKTCGIRAVAHGVNPKGEMMRAINVRCLDGVDLDVLDVTKFDGKSL